MGIKKLKISAAPPERFECANKVEQIHWSSSIVEWNIRSWVHDFCNFSSSIKSLFRTHVMYNYACIWVWIGWIFRMTVVMMIIMMCQGNRFDYKLLPKSSNFDFSAYKRVAMTQNALRESHSYTNAIDNVELDISIFFFSVRFQSIRHPLSSHHGYKCNTHTIQLVIYSIRAKWWV